MDWRKALPVVIESTPSEEQPAGHTFAFPLTSLAGGQMNDAPTLMAPWLLKQIYLSGCAITDFNVEPEAPPIGTMTAQLLIGGDIVWQQTDQVEMTLLVEATHFWGVNFNFAEDFINPVEFEVGRSLQLTGSFSFRSATAQALATEDALGVLGGYFKDLSLGESAPAETPNGTLSYASQKLSGHRTL